MGKLSYGPRLLRSESTSSEPVSEQSENQTFRIGIGRCCAPALHYGEARATRAKSNQEEALSLIA